MFDFFTQTLVTSHQMQCTNIVRFKNHPAQESTSRSAADNKKQAVCTDCELSSRTETSRYCFGSVWTAWLIHWCIYLSPCQAAGQAGQRRLSWAREMLLNFNWDVYISGRQDRADVCTWSRQILNLTGSHTNMLVAFTCLRQSRPRLTFPHPFISLWVSFSIFLKRWILISLPRASAQAKTQPRRGRAPECHGPAR